MGEALTPQEAARRLKVNVITIYRYIRSGRLPAAKLGLRVWRIDSDDVERLLRGSQPAVVQERL